MPKPVNLNNNNEWSSWIQKGKSVSVDQSGQLKLNGLGQKICRAIIPNYAKKQDVAVAQYLIAEMGNMPGAKGTNCIPGKDPEYAKTQKAAEAFLKNTLASYKSAEAKASAKSMQKLINMVKVGKALNIPHRVLEKNPEFVQFVIVNHLHHRIDKDYQDRKLGAVAANDDKIYLPFRIRSQRMGACHSSLDEWTKLPRDEKGRIKGYELMAYGWQKYEQDNATTLEPFKIIKLKPGEKPEYAIELVSAKPTYNIANPMGMFGHSWLRLYQPVLDKQGRPTDEVAVYSFGYFVTFTKKDVETKKFKVPDTFEFVEREKVTSKAVIDQAKFEKAKTELETFLKYSNKEGSAIKHAKREQVKHWLEEHTCTCGSFASKFYHDFTGENIEGRFAAAKTLFPDAVNKGIVKLGLVTPDWFTAMLYKIRLVTHGYFPSVMIENQRKRSGSEQPSSFK